VHNNQTEIAVEVKANKMTPTMLAFMVLLILTASLLVLTILFGIFKHFCCPKFEFSRDRIDKTLPITDAGSKGDKAEDQYKVLENNSDSVNSERSKEETT